jgi:hypothetical protein
LELSAYLAEKLKLNHIPLDLVRNIQNKLSFRRKCFENNIKVPKFFEIDKKLENIS